MIKLFIIKEIRQNITNKTIWMLGGVIAIATIVCMLMQIALFNNNSKAFDEYWIQRQKFVELNTEDIGSITQNMAIMPPAKLGMFFSGLKQFIVINAIDQNSIEYLFKTIDFRVLIGILFSLFAIILAFHTISGEREDGMLKLIDSYPVKRGKIILGKWLGIMAIVGALYSICYIIIILLITIFANVQISGVDIASLFLIYFIGLLYISGMVLLGMYISVKTKFSHLSLLIALLVWALTVIVLPCLPDYASHLFIKSPSPLSVLRYEDEIHKNQSKAIEKIKDRYRAEQIPENQIDSIAKNEIETTIANFREQNRHFTNNFFESLTYRTVVSTGLSFFSPYACYTLSVNEIAATGVAANIFLLQQRDVYYSTVTQYLKEKNERLEADPNYKPSYSDMPRFQFNPPSLTGRFLAASVPLALLIIFNFFFFVFTFKSFLKYDVR